MTEKHPLITIGITCFNGEDLIVKALEHAQDQDWPNYEILIVDDCSQDNSVAMISEYIKGKKNIFLFQHEENKGFPSALNTIVQHAKGEYITFFDDDDTSASDRLTKQYQRISRMIEEKKTPLVMCYTNRDVKYAGSNEIAYSFTSIGSQLGQEPHGEIVADYILWHSGKIGYQWGMFGSCTLMIHRDIFKSLGNFDPQFRRNTEWDMAVRCALQGGYFIGVNEALVTQTKTPTADKAGTKPLMYSLLLREKYQDYLKKKHVYFASRLMARSRFHGGKGRSSTSLAYTLFAMLVSPHVMVDKVQKTISKMK